MKNVGFKVSFLFLIGSFWHSKLLYFSILPNLEESRAGDLSRYIQVAQFELHLSTVFFVLATINLILLLRCKEIKIWQKSLFALIYIISIPLLLMLS